MFNNKLMAGAVLAGLVSLGFSMNAAAALPGGYAGIQAGWGTTHSDLSDNFVRNTSTSGLAGRVFAGYQFNQNWAIEAGYTRFSNATSKVNLYSYNPNDITIPLNLSIQEQAVDLVAKGILPLSNCFNLYADVGAAYLHARANISTPSIFGFTATHSDSTSNLLPTFGVGVSYDVTPNIPVSLGWNRIQKVGNSDLNSTDLVSLGIAYNFG